MKKVFLMVMLVLAVCLAGCGSNLKGDKPLSLEGYNKESITNNNVTMALRFNGKRMLAGTYEAKMKDGKKGHVAVIIPEAKLLGTRTPDIALLDSSARCHMYKNGGVYQIVYTDTYDTLRVDGKGKKFDEHNILIVDKEQKTAAIFVNVRDDGSYQDSVRGELLELKSGDVFDNLKLEKPFS